MESKKILLIGGGGHCLSVLDSLLRNNVYDEIGIIECRTDGNEHIMGVSIVGTDDDLPRLHRKGWQYAFITLGSIGNPARRLMIYDNLRRIGFEIPSIIDPSAIVAHEVKVCDGVFIAKQVVINTGSIIKCGAIINTGAIIEHDCSIGEFVHISPGCTLCGNVEVGRNSHVGAGSIVRQRITIASDVIVGAGSVVVKDLPSNVEAYGNPCKVVKGL